MSCDSNWTVDLADPPSTCGLTRLGASGSAPEVSFHLQNLNRNGPIHINALKRIRGIALLIDPLAPHARTLCFRVIKSELPRPMFFYVTKVSPCFCAAPESQLSASKPEFGIECPQLIRAVVISASSKHRLSERQCFAVPSSGLKNVR